jgi:hypothetical protein
MEKWQYLLIRVLRGLQGQEYVLTPPQAGIEALLHGEGPESTVALLDELGDGGWELIAVDVGDGTYWLKRRTTGV